MLYSNTFNTFSHFFPSATHDLFNVKRKCYFNIISPFFFSFKRRCLLAIQSTWNFNCTDDVLSSAVDPASTRHLIPYIFFQALLSHSPLYSPNHICMSIPYTTKCDTISFTLTLSSPTHQLFNNTTGHRGVATFSSWAPSVADQTMVQRCI